MIARLIAPNDRDSGFSISQTLTLKLVGNLQWFDKLKTIKMAALTNTTVGFGTAALGSNVYPVVLKAMHNGFRRFDTAEADWWYDQKATGEALKDFFFENNDDECLDESCRRTCVSEDLKISTKIPPWSLTSVSDIRANARNSRNELVGFCEDLFVELDDGITEIRPYPMDIYYIHAPKCWKGWHPRCEGVGDTLELRDSWRALEAVVGLDFSAERIGLSNIQPNELVDIIHWVEKRKAAGDNYPPPRIPDVVQAFADPLRPSKELRAVCEKYGIEFVSYSTLGTQHRQINGNPVLGHPTIKQLASKHKFSTAEVVLSWAMQRGMSVIPRSSKEKHIEELARLLEDKSTFLTEEDLQLIDQMEEKFRIW